MSPIPVNQLGAATALYHFTCAEHGYAGIGKQGMLRPNYHPYIGVELVWFTDLTYPRRQEVGLTSRLSRCDRMACRYRALDQAHCVPWLEHPAREAMPVENRMDLEMLGRPEHWWVSTESVPVRLV